MHSFRYRQGKQEDGVRKQWGAFVRTALEALSLKHREVAKAAGCHESYITRYADGHVPSRPKVKLFGEAIGNVPGAMVAAGLIPVAGQATPFSDNVRELLCILTFLEPGDQDTLITPRVLDAVRFRIRQLGLGRQEAC